MFAARSGTGSLVIPPQVEVEGDNSGTTTLPPSASCFGNCGACGTKLGTGRRPLLLPCLHSVCHECVPREVGVDFVDCPLCGVGYSLKDVTDDPFCKESQSASGAQSISPCGGCEATEVHGWCVDCGEALCSICISAHKRVRVTREHTILPQRNSRVPSPTVYCKAHRTVPAMLFCLSCDHPFCRDCFLRFHKKHSFKFLQDAAIDEKENIRSLMEKVKLQRKTVRKSLSDLDRRLLDLTELQCKVNEQLRDTLKCIKAALLDRATRLTMDVQNLYNAERGGVLKRQSVLRKLEERQSYLLSFTERALETESHTALLSCREKIHSQLRDVLSCATFPGTSMMKVTFRCSQDTYNQIAMFGTIVAKPVPFACTDHQNTVNEARICSGVSSTQPPPSTSSSTSSKTLFSLITAKCPEALLRNHPAFHNKHPNPSQNPHASSQPPPTSSNKPPTSLHTSPPPPYHPHASSQLPPASSNKPPTSLHYSRPPPYNPPPPASTQHPPTSSNKPPTSLHYSRPPPYNPPTNSQHPPTHPHISCHNPPTHGSSQIKRTSSHSPPTYSLNISSFPLNPPTSSQHPPTLSHYPPTFSQNISSFSHNPPTYSHNTSSSLLNNPCLSKMLLASSHNPLRDSQAPPIVSHTRVSTSLSTPTVSQPHLNTASPISPLLLFSSAILYYPDPPVSKAQITTKSPFSQASPTAVQAAVLPTWSFKEDKALGRPYCPYKRAPPAGHKPEEHTDHPATTENEPTSTEKPTSALPTTEISKVTSADHKLLSFPATTVPSDTPPESALVTLKRFIDEVHQSKQSQPSAEVEVEVLSPQLPISSTGSAELQPQLPINSTGSAELQPQLPISSPGSAELQPQLPISTPGSAELQPQSPAQVGLEDESALYRCSVKGDGIDETDNADTENARKPRKAVGRLLIPRISLLRIPVSFPPLGNPLPQFRVRPNASKQGFCLEQIARDTQGTIHLKLAERDRPVIRTLRYSLRSKAKPVVAQSSVASPALSRVTDRRANQQLVFPDSTPKSGAWNASRPSIRPRPVSAKKKKKKKKERCAVCHSGGELVLCTDCGRSFHRDCYVPLNTATDSSGQWQCMLCEDLSDVWSPCSREPEGEPSLSLADQRKCEHLFLTLISKKHSAVLYQQSELLPHSSHYVDITLIRGRLLQKLSPAYRTPSEFVSDIWLLLDTLSKSLKVARPVAKLQKTFRKTLRQVFWMSLHPSLLESPQKKGEEGSAVGSVVGRAEPEAAKEARKTRKRTRDPLKKNKAEPVTKKLCVDVGRDGEKE